MPDVSVPLPVCRRQQDQAAPTLLLSEDPQWVTFFLSVLPAAWWAFHRPLYTKEGYAKNVTAFVCIHQTALAESSGGL
jgi:hypothetical protein